MRGSLTAYALPTSWREGFPAAAGRATPEKLPRLEAAGIALVISQALAVLVD